MNDIFSSELCPLFITIWHHFLFSGVVILFLQNNLLLLLLLPDGRRYTEEGSFFPAWRWRLPSDSRWTSTACCWTTAGSSSGSRRTRRWSAAWSTHRRPVIRPACCRSCQYSPRTRPDRQWSWSLWRRGTPRSVGTCDVAGTSGNRNNNHANDVQSTVISADT